MNMEKMPGGDQERREGPFTKEEVVEVFETGDKGEGLRRFAAWKESTEQERDRSPEGRERFNHELDTLEILASFEHADVMMHEIAVAESMIDSDTSLSVEEREDIAKRLASIWAKV